MKLSTTLRLAKESLPDTAYRRLVVAAQSVLANEGTPIPILRLLDLELASAHVDHMFNAVACLSACLADQREARDRISRLFAADCAEHVLPIFESAFPDDNRARYAIAVARRYARREARGDELLDAEKAAGDLPAPPALLAQYYSFIELPPPNDRGILGSAMLAPRFAAASAWEAVRPIP